jgi:signal transduction histidine kinase
MKKPTIICVDDEKIVLTSVKAELKEALGDNYIIETAEGGEDALAIVEELIQDDYEIPVIIADYIMPGIKGDELLRRVHRKLPATLKIMLTGQADSQAVGNVVNEAKLYRYIAKPWDRKDFELTIKEATRSFFQAKRIEEQNDELREMNRTLEVRVELRTRELSETLEQLKSAQGQLVQSEKMAVLGKLTAGLAHEINNPIGAVISAADVSIRAVDKISNAVEVSADLQELKSAQHFVRSMSALRENYDTIITGSDRVASLALSLKKFVHLDGAVLKSVDLHDGIESTLTLLQPEIRDRIMIERDYSELPGVFCRPGEINQVFMTVLTNAIEAIEGDGKVTIHTSMKGRYATVSITDTGKGISDKLQASLFELDFTIKGKRVGVGLGLPTALSIVQNHKGFIEVESSVGNGATFTIRLPLE